MQRPNQSAVIDSAIAIVAEMSPQSTDGTWLEDVTVAVGPHVKEWDVARCYLWSEWPDREIHFPGTTNQDIGIDCVAIRRSDREHVAIQCKSRQLNAAGQGAPISKGEIDSFASTSAGEFWAERWIVTNGDNPVSGNSQQAMSMTDKPVKMVSIANDLLQQQAAFTSEECPHCEPNPDGEERRQSKSCMQAEAIAESVRILREHEKSESGGLPIGQARGKIILPCGTGKTRISLRIVEELTPPGELSIVLCPSIALVAQIRREYLQHAERDIRALAVCSDETAGYDPKKESTRNTAADPTLDNSNVSASEVKGKVTTNPAEIAQWIREGFDSEQVSVIFGTYQSGSRISEALIETGVTAKVLVADEAHRTAGLRRRRHAKSSEMSDEERRIRDFTLCHDNDAFPSTYRVYQTATPRIYDTSRVNQDRASDWIVRTMDDETVFGVELYRKSYVEAVKNRWLADYRIIAVGVNGPDAYNIANALAGETKSKGKNRLTSTHFLRGLAFSLALGGATQNRGEGTVPIKSCIAFMNTVDKSKNMKDALQTPAVRKWLQDWLDDYQDGQTAAQYTLEHLDATSNVTARENAKHRLAEATVTDPHGIINVGIFGEGTDSPSLNAVAFLEARKSPIDVIQAVGRAMRTAEGKEMGYIICPIVIPPNADPEQWLSTSDKEEGWQELGQILLALRAHDQRIEDNLADLMQLYIPQPPPALRTIVAVASGEDKRIHYREHEGAPREAQEAVERVLEGKSTLTKEFRPISETPTTVELVSDEPTTVDSAPLLLGKTQYGTAEESRRIGETKPTPLQHAEHPTEPTQIVTGKKNHDGSIELRMSTVAREKPASDGTRGMVDIRKSKAKAKDMINKGEGVRIPTTKESKPRPTREERMDQAFIQQLKLSGLEDQGNAIRMNLLSKSGLVDNRVVRDLNILESSVREASRHLRDDDLQPALDRHFGLDNLKDDKRKSQADGCTIAALLMMNAAMLHQRIANGSWLTGVSDLEAVKNDVNVVRRITREWHRILIHDFRPVLEPAVNAIEAVEDTGKLAGLERALRHISAEAERIAETYADMGADHAGPLFNRVMGNQASDGAYFTRPVAASIAARLTLDACGDVNWSDPEVWREHKTIDLACGSGTLLAAMLTDMKRRAREQGASEPQIAELQKLAVEETIKGLDINPVSLQLAASQLTAGNQEIRYRQMGLHLMPYGPQVNNAAHVSAGTLELLGQKAIVARHGELALPDERIASQSVWPAAAELEDAVDAARDVRIVIMNPPFTNRSKMGEKFPEAIQRALRERIDQVRALLAQADPELKNLATQNSVAPNFVSLADHCIPRDNGVMAMINPTIALTGTSGSEERHILSQRYHIHTILTCHQPGQINLSQNTNVNESIVVLRRHTDGPSPPTRFINLDRLPVDDDDVADWHRSLLGCEQGPIPNGWGEVSYWPAERIAEDDWTPAIWRSAELAASAYAFASRQDMQNIEQENIYAAGQRVREFCKVARESDEDGFPLLYSKGADGQTTIAARPDRYYRPEDPGNKRCMQGVNNLKARAAHLLIADGQRNATARLTAVASDAEYVGMSWMPVAGFSPEASKGIAVFLNSTPGRLQLMRNAGRTIEFPMYMPGAYANIRIPNIKDDRIRLILAECWERTRDMEVPQFRDGECEVRRLWDEAVAEAMGWDPAELTRLRLLLHQEPHVSGLGYGQYADAVEIEPAARERFRELADQWEIETALLSNSEQAAKHPAHQEIMSMGEPVVPLILERMQSQGGHWFHALREITNANPVQPDDRGNVGAMQAAWLEWGEDNGYV